MVAVKCIPRVKLEEHGGLVGQLVETEITVLDQCNSPNVVKLRKFC
jgi:hypothetical protein